MTTPTICDIVAEQETLVEAGVPQWKRQLAFEEAQAARQTVAYGPNGEGFTRQRLLDLFNVVANPDNWKVEIDTMIDLAREDEEALKQAIIFFTGSTPTIKYLGNGLEAHVTAAGYYQTCGA